jgi:hypothetical protein
VKRETSSARRTRTQDRTFYAGMAIYALERARDCCRTERDRSVLATTIFYLRGPFQRKGVTRK